MTAARAGVQAPGGREAGSVASVHAFLGFTECRQAVCRSGRRGRHALRAHFQQHVRHPLASVLVDGSHADPVRTRLEADGKRRRPHVRGRHGLHPPASASVKRSAVMWAEHFASKPAVGQPVTLPFGPLTRDTWIYKDDCAEQLVRLALKPSLSHFAYNNGGASVTAEELANAVRHWLPDAKFKFDETKPTTPLIDRQDGARIEAETGFAPRSLLDGVRAHINEARKEAGLEPVGA